MTECDMTRRSVRPRIRTAVLLLFALTALTFDSAARGDTLESTGGAVVQGIVTARDAKFITMEVVVGGKPVERKYPIGIVKAITIDGTREILQGPGAGTKTKVATPGDAGTGTGPAGTGAAAAQRTK